MYSIPMSSFYEYNELFYFNAVSLVSHETQQKKHHFHLKQQLKEFWNEPCSVFELRIFLHFTAVGRENKETQSNFPIVFMIGNALGPSYGN